MPADLGNRVSTMIRLFGRATNRDWRHVFGDLLISPFRATRFAASAVNIARAGTQQKAQHEPWPFNNDGASSNACSMEVAMTGTD
jgi:hypothetical protein